MNPFTMRSKQLFLFAAALVSIFMLGCKKETEEFQSDAISDYLPLQEGKYITYQLDSTVFTNFGTTTEIHSYQEKHLVDAEITDGMGRPSYRIMRFTRDAAGTQSWAAAGTYFITPTTKTIELVENNLRFVKLALPVKENFSWKGNQFLPDDPYAPVYDFQVNTGMYLWDYTYTSVNGTETINNETYDSVLTVDAVDESTNMDPETAEVFDANFIGSVSRLHEEYAKGVGLIYQDYIMWDYQSPNAGNPDGKKTGFRVKRSIIDHN